MTNLNFKPADRPNAKPHLLFKELEDGGVIYDPATETAHSLNPSAAFIWSFCDGKHTIMEIISVIRENFTQFKAAPEQEVFKTLQKFWQLDLITLP